MAVVTIDAKAELAQIQAAMDEESGQAAPPSAAEAEPAAAVPTEPATNGHAKPDDDEDADFAERLGLTPAQHNAFSDIMRKRISKKVRETKEAEEFAAAQYSERKLAEARAAALEQELAGLKAKGEVPRETAEKARPERKDFQDDMAYLDAMIAWGVEDGLKKQAIKDAEAAAERRAAEINQAAADRITKARELVPDFAQVGATAEGNISTFVKDYLLKSDMIAEVTYYLAKNPKVVESLAKLEPDQQLVTIGKIESTLKPFGSSDSKANSGAKPSDKAASSGKASSEDEPSDEAGIPPSRARSSAPVITPLNQGNGASGGHVDPRDMNIREHIVDFQKRNRANLGLRKRH